MTDIPPNGQVITVVMEKFFDGTSEEVTTPIPCKNDKQVKQVAKKINSFLSKLAKQYAKKK